MMEARFIVLFCVLAAAANAANPHKSAKIKLGYDRPSLQSAVSDKATIQCCYASQDAVNVTWMLIVMSSRNMSQHNHVDMQSERVNIREEEKHNMKCSKLMLEDIKLNDTGLYRCALSQEGDSVLTPGTYLQVYEPIHMILHFSERSKNSIITAEGVLLLLCVLLPGTILICKSKRLNELEKRKGREEENIYEGLNLDDCNSTYHQIQRSLVQGPYQDVINNDNEDIQLEKP